MNDAPAATATALPPAEPGLVSVVIPLYNRAGLVGETILSALAQDYRPLEIVVVDDGSTDGSAEAAEALATACDTGRALRVHRQPNGGPARARNAGLSLARGNMILFLDSDDLLAEGAIGRLAGRALADPEAGVVYGDWREMRAEPGGARRFGPVARLEEPADPILEFLTIGRWVPLSASLIRRGVAERAGGFDEGLGPVQEDMDFLILLAMAGARFRRVEGLAALRRMHPGQLQAMKPEVWARAGGRMLRKARATLEARGEFTPERRRAWGHYLWRMSAEAAESDPAGYRAALAEAREAWPELEPDRPIWRWTARLAGLERADRWMARGRRLKRAVRAGMARDAAEGG